MSIRKPTMKDIHKIWKNSKVIYVSIVIGIADPNCIMACFSLNVMTGNMIKKRVWNISYLR